MPIWFSLRRSERQKRQRIDALLLVEGIRSVVQQRLLAGDEVVVQRLRQRAIDDGGLGVWVRRWRERFGGVWAKAGEVELSHAHNLRAPLLDQRFRSPMNS